MGKRMTIVDLWKFIAAIMIMVHHLFYLGNPFSSCSYGNFGYIYVEFFFILSGFFTFKHFNKQDDSPKNKITGDYICKQSIKYTINKFKPFLPYTTVAITIQYFFTAPFTLLKSVPSEFFGHFINYPFEVLLLGETIKSEQVLVPIWFLSAMLLVFPIIALICQIRNKYLVLISSSLYTLIFYGQIPIAVIKQWPIDIFRAFGGMLLGVCVCIITDLIKEKNNNITINVKKTICLTIVETGGMIFILIISFLNVKQLDKIIVYLFAVCIGVMLSGYSLTARINNSFFSYLGKISMPIYILHWVIATAILRADKIFAFPTTLKLIAYFAGTIVVSVIAYFLVNRVKLSLKKRVKKT